MKKFEFTNLTLIKRIKQKNLEMVTFYTDDKRVTLHFEEEYHGAGLDVNVKAYWRGIIPYYLNNDQKKYLIKEIKNFLISNVYGK